MIRTLLATCAALALLAAAPAVPADEVAEARAQYDAGAKLFHAGKYREAISRFEAAYRIKPHGAIHYNVAQCREKLGEWPAALRAYQDYLREVPEATDRAAVRASIGRLEQRIASAGVQALLVYSDPPGAALRLDGKPRGRTPFHITLPPGVYRVALSLDGFAPEEQEVEVNLAASRLVEVVLRPQASRAGAASAAAAAAAAALAKPPAAPLEPIDRSHASALSSGVPVAAATTRTAPPATLDLTPSPLAPTVLGPPVPPPPPPPTKDSWTPRRIAAWSTGVVAVVAAAVGVSSGIQAKNTSAQLRDGTVRTGPEADALAHDAKAKAKSANTLYVIGGAAAAASVTLFVLEGRF